MLLVRVSDYAQARGGGVLGRVLLYRTLPYERTPHGGIALPKEAAGDSYVVLHLGDALLARGRQTAFFGRRFAAGRYCLLSLGLSSQGVSMQT